jgi:hypothetical protein
MRDIAEMLKVNTFQLLRPGPRTLLGEAALTLEDFDFDPGNLVPAMESGAPGTPRTRRRAPREQRAQFFHKMPTFRWRPTLPFGDGLPPSARSPPRWRHARATATAGPPRNLEVPAVGKFPPRPFPPPAPADRHHAVFP